MTEQDNAPSLDPKEDRKTATNLIRLLAWFVVAIALIILLGFASGYFKWLQAETAGVRQQKELAQLYDQINPKDGYPLPVSYGDLGPQLVEAGVIDYDAFANVMRASGDGLSDRQIDILKKGSYEQVVINAQNAHFLLNFFWAVGLANRSSILTDGSMVRYSEGHVERFASTGGWTLASKPVTELYASLGLISLTPEQQARVEEVAAAIYRPCCDNLTAFPDCNHGMAMLGLLELMASRDASVDEMFKAAKYVNAYWFPQQTLETAMYLQTNQNINFKDADARLVVGKNFSSASGAAMVHQSLLSSGLLKQISGQGGSCSS